MDKLRAIHLFEADWNGLNKLVFARRMMAAANSSNAVPPEQFANTKSRAIDGVMTRTLQMIRYVFITTPPPVPVLILATVTIQLVTW